uniref:Uncharacterized protein n=1 Tax=Pygocentrus nattereri TaxID=42514 RepID=A0AAR2LFI0_PYGNA
MMEVRATRHQSFRVTTLSGASLKLKPIDQMHLPLLRAIAVAQAEVGSVSASIGPIGVKARGPNVAAEAEVSWLGAGAMARAEVASVAAAAGPFGVKYGLAVDTGVKLSLTKGELKFLGTGVTVGRTTGVSVLGNEVTISL